MTGFTSGMRTSLTDKWATPQYLFDALDKEFNFTLDVCADESNHKCSQFYTERDDGLSKPWTGVCWMNPPYGREIGKWVEKAKNAARGGGRRGVPVARPHGHPLVEGACDGGHRVALHQRSREVRGCGEQRPVPLGYSNLRNAEGARDPPGLDPGGGSGMTLETLNETPYTYSGDGKLTGEDIRIAMDLARAYTLMEVLANATERIDELDLGSATPTATIACDAIRQQIGYLKARMEHDMERRAPALGLPGVVG